MWAMWPRLWFRTKKSAKLTEDRSKILWIWNLETLKSRFSWIKGRLTCLVWAKIRKKFKVWLFPKAEAALLTEMGGIGVPRICFCLLSKNSAKRPWVGVFYSKPLCFHEKYFVKLSENLFVFQICKVFRILLNFVKKYFFRINFRGKTSW